MFKEEFKKGDLFEYGQMIYTVESVDEERNELEFFNTTNLRWEWIPIQEATMFLTSKERK